MRKMRRKTRVGIAAAFLSLGIVGGASSVQMLTSAPVGIETPTLPELHHPEPAVGTTDPYIAVDPVSS